jgi:hypothetical protein
VRRQAGVLARHLQHPPDLTRFARRWSQLAPSCLVSITSSRPPASSSAVITSRCPFSALMKWQLSPLSLVSIASQLVPPDLQQRFHHLQMPILRTCPEAAGFLVCGQHHQLALPDLQQRFHHLQMPILHSRRGSWFHCPRSASQLAPPHLQQRFQHLLMPLRRTDQEAAFSIVHNHHKLAPHPQQRFHHIQMPHLRDDAKAADSIVPGQHQE